MKTIILAAAAAIGLSGCVGAGGYGSGVSIGYGNGGYGGGYGYNNYAYNGYSGYGGSSCVAYDRFGRAYYTCGYGNYYGSNRYSYSPRTVVYYYPGYSYRNGYYYDRTNRRLSSRELYNRHHRNVRRQR